MAKILLVEDDNNLREIYQARLQAEGYEIVAAKDGEEALVVAKKERPDLVIADVMMPRVSGFEMLDILRNTDGLKDVHVIMLTALGQAEDKTRADSLGADRYLVKSQVTLEDIVKTASDVLAGAPANIAPGTQAAAAAAEQAAPATPTATIPVAAPPDATPPAAPPPAEPPAAPPAPVSIPVTAPPDAAAPATPAAPAAPPPTTDASTTPTPAPATPPAAAATDDKLVTDAVKDLIADTAKPEETTAPATTAPPVTPPAPAPTPPAAPPPAEPPAAPPPPPSVPPVQNGGQTMQPVLPGAPQVIAPSPAPATPVTPADSSDNVEVANKKIIQPLAPGSAQPPADLHDLLAKEGITNLDDTPHDYPAAGAAPHPPGHVIAPGNNPPDPNSISL